MLAWLTLTTCRAWSHAGSKTIRVEIYTPTLILPLILTWPNTRLRALSISLSIQIVFFDAYDFSQLGDNSQALLLDGSSGTATTENALARLDEALAQVDTLRSDLGAIQNRFESAITNLQTNATNLSAARSRIEDADYAVEVANMTRAQILQQAGTSVLAQANQVPQSVLSLLG